MTNGREVTKQGVWASWIRKYVDTECTISLFETDDDGVVKTKLYGRDNRPILKRSRPMEDLLRREGGKVVEDWQASGDIYEGIIYLMYTLEGETVVPWYIGKVGMYGRDGERLSANLMNIRTNNSKLARWGDGYDYHIGDLSSVVLDHQGDNSVNRDSKPPGKYKRWADALFESGTRQLRQPIYFWARAWREDDTGGTV